MLRHDITNPRSPAVQARRNLEASFLRDAEMVFTTLSSTGRQAFQQAAQKAPFQTGQRGCCLVMIRTLHLHVRWLADRLG